MFPRARIHVLIPIYIVAFRRFRWPALVYIGLWFGIQVATALFLSSSAGGVAVAAHIAGFRPAWRYCWCCGPRPSAPTSKMMMSRASSLLVPVVALALWLAIGSVPAHADEPAPIDDLVTFFDEVVFGPAWSHKQAPPIIVKVEDKTTIELYGADAGRAEAFTRQHVALLQRLTGLKISLRMGGARGGDGSGERPRGVLKVNLVPRAEMPDLLVQSWIGQRLAEQMLAGLCFFATLGRETVRGGMVGIEAGLSETTMRHCLVEEITQTFGVFSDSQAIMPSIYNDPGPHLTAPTINDMLILRALYEPELLPGMPRKIALPIARIALQRLRSAALRTASRLSINRLGKVVLGHPTREVGQAIFSLGIEHDVIKIEIGCVIDIADWFVSNRMQLVRIKAVALKHSSQPPSPSRISAPRRS